MVIVVLRVVAASVVVVEGVGTRVVVVNVLF